MRFLVVGCGGMLGQDVVAVLKARGHEVRPIDLPEIDLRDPSSVAGLATGEWGQFDWCVNCAAYTAVDKAESEGDLATQINTLGPGYLAEAAKMAGTRLLHISTDFVFDGTKREPYVEEDPTRPLGVYGRSKRDGEEAVLNAAPTSVVLRTAWLYGPCGPSFPRTMIRAWLAGRDLRVVADQVGSPTYTADLARVMADVMEKGLPGGIYHATGPDVRNWRDFAAEAIETYRDQVLEESRPVEVAPIRSEDWPTPTERPKYSVLSFQKLQEQGIEPMRPMSEALEEFVRRLTPPI